jgi:hypothetical protein
MPRALSKVNTLGSRSSASLFAVTRCDHREPVRRAEVSFRAIHGYMHVLDRPIGSLVPLVT